MPLLAAASATQLGHRRTPGQDTARHGIAQPKHGVDWHGKVMTAATKPRECNSEAHTLPYPVCLHTADVLEHGLRQQHFGGAQLRAVCESRELMLSAVELL
jgi:hypothetical protein